MRDLAVVHNQIDDYQATRFVSSNDMQLKELF